MRRVLASLAVAAAIAVVFARQARPQAPPSFVNWESPHVHPLDMTPDGMRLLSRVIMPRTPAVKRSLTPLLWRDTSQARAAKGQPLAGASRWAGERYSKT